MTFTTKDLEGQCKATVEHFRRDLAKVRTGRASAGMLEGVQVEYYGSAVPLVQMGLINAPEPRLVTVQVYDASAVEAVEKAIRQADLGLNPAREGNLIRMSVPALNEERRKEIIKKLHKTAEENKVAVRGHRRDAIDLVKKLEKDKKIAEDDVRRAQDDVQKVTDRYVAEIDTLLQQKEKEMLEV